MMSSYEWRRFEALYCSTGANRSNLVKILSRYQNNKCSSCGLDFEPKDKKTLDHTIPKSLGGADAIGNFTAMHYHCNHKKESRPPTGCELIFLMAVNLHLNVLPNSW